MLVLAELALAALTLATVATLWRLFDDASFFLPLAAHAVAAHALVALLRRRGAGVGASAAVTAVVAILALSWFHLLDTTWFGLPTAETARVAGDQLELGWRTFGEVRAPAPVLTGFVLSAGAALWAAAWLADLAAFRQWTPFEALIPSGTVFLFTSLFAAERARPLSAVLWLAAAMGFVLLHRTARQQSSPSWLGSDARLGTQALVRTGAALAVAAVVVGWAVGPRLPGAGAEGLVPVTPDRGDGGRTTISPLVQIRGRLVEQSQAALFTVTSAQREYWRMTSLDIFDGEVWSSRGTYGEADGRLAGSGNRDVPSTPVTQSFTILDLSTIWLPAAFEATEVRIDDADVRWDDVSSTLIVSTDLDTSDGLRYEVVSDIPAFAPEDLTAGGEVPSDLLDVNTDLPGGFPETVRAEAQRITAGASTPYEQALALQDSFRDGTFRYSLEAPDGHSASAIEDFLFVTRTGYCEQFAGAFAAMARSIDLPTRVAVGFTPGEPDPSEPGRYIVRGENAHAWPEVFIAGAGWVRFEPTPGRGAPGDEVYTGHAEQQDTAGPSTEATTVPEADPSAVPPADDPTATTAPPLEDVGAEPDPIDLPRPDREAVRLGPLVRRLGLVAAVLAVATVVGAAGTATVRALRRWRRRSRADTPEALVRALGDEVVELVAVLGVLRPRHLTELEFARRVGAATGSGAARELGDLLTRAAFDPDGIDDDDAALAAPLVDELREAVRARTTRLQRMLAAVDPRPPQRQAEARARGRTPMPSGTRGPRIHIVAAPDT
jgi:transglutaminase-like putative cysteine protease